MRAPSQSVVLGAEGDLELRDVVLSVARGGRTLRFDDPLIGTLQSEDVLVVVKAHRSPADQG